MVTFRSLLWVWTDQHLNHCYQLMFFWMWLLFVRNSLLTGNYIPSIRGLPSAWSGRRNALVRFWLFIVVHYWNFFSLVVLIFIFSCLCVECRSVRYPMLLYLVQLMKARAWFWCLITSAMSIEMFWVPLTLSNAYLEEHSSSMHPLPSLRWVPSLRPLTYRDALV